MHKPKNCKRCGGHHKMQLGSYVDKTGQKYVVPSIQQQIQQMLAQSMEESDAQATPRMEPNETRPYTDRIQEGISKGILEAPRADSPDEQQTAQQWYDNVKGKPTQKKMKNPYDTLQQIGIGMRGFRTGLGWLSGAIERGRQNQYDYKQQTALGIMNPMQASDFQPQGRGVNYYAEQGGINPFSYYSKYGGNLKKLIKEFNNDAKMDFGSGDDDQGMMQYGGMPQFPMDNIRKMKFDRFGNPSKIKYFRGQQQEMMPMQMPQMFEDLNNPGNYFNNQQQPVDLFGNTLSQMKKGGYEIDRMLVVRKFLPELLHFGRMMPHSRYRNYQQGGFPPLNPNSGNPIPIPYSNEEGDRLKKELVKNYVTANNPPIPGVLKNSGDAFDTYNNYLYENPDAAMGLNPAAVTRFLTSNYNPDGSRKFSIYPSAPNIKKGVKSVDDKENEEKLKKKHEKIQGVLGKDYYQQGGAFDPKEFSVRRGYFQGENAYTAGPAQFLGADGKPFVGTNPTPKAYPTIPNDVTDFYFDPMENAYGYINPKTGYVEYGIPKPKANPPIAPASQIKNMMASLKKGGLTPNKAREILHDGTAQGKPLTDKQRRYFGAMSKGHTNYRGK